MYRELQMLLFEVTAHFLKLGYPDADLFLGAAIAAKYDATGAMARTALQIFQTERTFSGPSAVLLGRLQALLDDLAALEDA